LTAGDKLDAERRLRDLQQLVESILPPPDTPVGPLKPKPGPKPKRLPREVAEQLEALLDQRAADPRKLSQQSIADRLGISRRQVRDAEQRRKARPGSDP